MPLTPLIPLAYAHDPNDYVLIAGPFPVPDTERIEVHGVKFSNHLLQGGGSNVPKVQFHVYASKNGGWDFDTEVDSLGGGTWKVPESYNDVIDTYIYKWVVDPTYGGPAALDLPYNKIDYYDATEVFLVAKLWGDSTRDVLEFAQVQVSYAIKTRDVIRVDSPRRVLAGSGDYVRYRTTGPIKPMENVAHFRCIFEVQGLYSQGPDPEVTAIWWYRDEPSDPTDWTYGGSIGGPAESDGHYIVRTSSETGPLATMQTHQEIAFGFMIQNTGTSADHTFAVVEGTFEYF